MVTTINNPKKQEAMPSYFTSIQSAESYLVSSWQSVKNFITHNPLVSNFTMPYRKRLAVSKQYADELRPQSPAITIEEAAPYIKELLKLWGFDFEFGRYNEYMLHFGKVCVRYGIDQAEALKYANAEFVRKFCLCFDVKQWLKDINFHILYRIHSLSHSIYFVQFLLFPSPDML